MTAAHAVAGGIGLGDAVEPEMAEVAAHLAPGCEQLGRVEEADEE